MEWERYREIILQAWERTLAEHSGNERSVQEVLERYACLLPIESETGHHGPWLGVYAQPPLQGVRRRVPDFMWIERSSSKVTAVCVEIERPDKHWFNRDGTPTATYTQAVDQFAEWRAWFEEQSPADFFKAYRLPQDWLSNRVFRQRFILIYGRRAEFATGEGSVHGGAADRLNRKRAQNARDDETLMTYDALYPSQWFRDIPTLKRDGEDIRVSNIPPTFTTGGSETITLAHSVVGLDEAIQRMEDPPSPERIEYLVRRIAFWRSFPSPRGFGFSQSRE